jgi:hypothetical protein
MPAVAFLFTVMFGVVAGSTASAVHDYVIERNTPRSDVPERWCPPHQGDSSEPLA